MICLYSGSIDSNYPNFTYLANNDGKIYNIKQQIYDDENDKCPVVNHFLEGGVTLKPTNYCMPHTDSKRKCYAV